MSLQLSQVFRNWIAADGQAVPIVTLYDVSISDAVTMRLVEGNPTGKNVTYSGNEYTPAAIRREPLEQTIEGDLGAFRVAVSNVDGIAGGYIEQNDLDGRTVTITTVPLSTLDPADALIETYTIQDQAYDRVEATVTLGHTHLFKRRVPWWRYQRTRCMWPYERRFDWTDPENGCRAYSDEFEESSTQSFYNGAATDAEQKRRFGWYTLNALKVKLDASGVWDVNDAMVPRDFNGVPVPVGTEPGILSAMTLEVSAGGYGWSGGTKDGPFCYRRIAGDFDVWTRIQHTSWGTGAIMGICCQEALSGQDSWILFGRAFDDFDAAPELRVRASLNGSDEAGTVAEQPTHTYLRMRRVGDVFTCFSRLTEPASVAAYATGWTQADQRTLAMDPEIRIGLALSSPAPGLAGFTSDFFRFQAGGLTTCDRTPGGEGGCRLHDNVHRIMAFQGIPRR